MTNDSKALLPIMRPWYREPMLWLVIALPLIAVIASFLTLAVAIKVSPENTTQETSAQVTR
jgi:hypothetical protein